MRSGRIRSALRTRSRIATWPLPSMFGGRASSGSTWSWWSWSSFASSTVTMRSSSGMKLDTTFRSVVFPVPVPPLTTMFRRPRTHRLMKCAVCGVHVPKLMRSSTLYGSVANFRMVMNGPPIDSGCTMTFTREPSGSRASTIGLASSTRRPTWLTILSMMRRRCVSSTNFTSLITSRPLRSTYTRFGPFTMTSVIDSSRSSGSIGP